MPALIIIISCSLLVGAVIFSLYRRQRRFSVNRYLILASIAGIVLGGWLIFSQTARFQRVEEMKQWPSVHGEIVDSWLEGERAMHPVVIYRYTVDSVDYIREDTLYTPSFGGKRRKYEVSMKTLALYPPGLSVNVYYNLSDPEVAYIELPEHWDLYGKFSFGITLYVLGLLVLTVPRRRETG